MHRVLQRVIDAQLGWAGRLGGALQPPFEKLFHRITPIRDLLTGTWLGHPLHPAITDLPVGAFIVTFILDLANQRTGADVALGLGILGLLGAAVTGLADYSDTFGGPRDVGTLHAVTMVIALVLYLISLGLRLGQPVDRTVPVVIAFVGLLVVIFGAYLGGDLVFRLGNVVDRHAWEEGGHKWLPLDITVIPEATPTKAMAGEDVLLVIRFGDTIHAMHEVCAHAGGPLSEGRIVDGCIECPWHQSRFRLADGHVVRGPAVFDQPGYEVRASATGFEARRLS